MAVTSIWAVKRSVKDLLDYAVNPEKTANPEQDNLMKVMQYAKNPDKTEKLCLVSGVNCIPEYAYERMMETKRRYGKCDGVVAFHAYQSFKPGETTPEECHALGVELAKRLWGDRFEVLVATHTDHLHLHNHFVCNSVSFRDGLKFRCTKSYHLELMRASDEICRENRLSVIQNPPRRGQPRAAWMAEKAGKPTHRSILKWDIDDAMNDCIRLEDLRYALEVRGYHYVRDDGYEHATVIADGWKRPVKIDSLGSRYTETALRGRVMDNLPKLGYYHEMYVPERARFYELVQERYTRYSKMSVIELIFATILELFEIHVIPEPKNYVYYEPLSPAVRAEEIASERYMDCFNLITRNNLHDENDIDTFIASKESELSGLEAERRQVDNYRRRHKDEPGVAERCKAARRALTEKIIPVRHTLGLAREIMPRFNRAVELLKTEKQTEERLVPDVIERLRNKPKQNTKEQEYER